MQIQVPSSKSLTQRALVLAALSDRPCSIEKPLKCDDSLVLSEALTLLGASIEKEQTVWHVIPGKDLLVPDKPLWLENAGTAVRFVTGLAPLISGSVVIDGNQAMHQRPMPVLLKTLQELGVVVEELGLSDCPPVRLNGAPVEFPNKPWDIAVPLSGSSQELSAILMAACRFPCGCVIHTVENWPSKPYLDLTLDMLHAFGIEVQQPNPGTYVVPGKMPRCDRISIEGDWSSASYPLAASFLTGKPVDVTNVSTDSTQGDRLIVECLQKLKEPGPQTLSMADCPDLVPTVLACALFEDAPTTIADVAHLRLKECDRIGVPALELKKIGANIETREDGLKITPTPLKGPATLNPAHDHRLAMAFGLISLRVPNITISDPGCVSKSYPDFWSMLDLFRPKNS